MNPFVHYIQQYVNLDLETQQSIDQLTQTHVLNKGDMILKQGQVCHRMYFLEKGTIRTFFYQEGKEVTHWIYPENSMITAWHSYILRKPSQEYIEATESSTIHSLTYDQWQDLYAQHGKLEKFGRLMAEEQMALIDDFYKGYYFLSAKEKYQKLITVFPSITQRANLGHIASMLGISQETLSRIRK